LWISTGADSVSHWRDLAWPRTAAADRYRERPSSDLLLQAIRAGLAEFLVKPLSPEALSEALARLQPRMRLEHEDTTGSLARTVAFFSAKGGSGASTAVTNLAIELHRITGKRTLLVDLDAELGEISLLLGTQPQFNFTDLIQNLHRMDANLLGSYIEQHSSGVHCCQRRTTRNAPRGSPAKIRQACAICGPSTT
jgi:Flp pilus assembly CpaE family ATPase